MTGGPWAGVGVPGRQFSGVRVVDVTSLAPGPYCSMLLADLGASVIAVGNARGIPPLEELSRGKTFITLDLKSSTGVDALHAIVKDADVFLEGFRPGVAARLGAGYEQLKTINPGLVYCSLTGYGQDGPLAREAGHDLNYLAASGVLGATGPANDAPQFPLNLLADFGAGGLLAAFGIAAALLERSRTGTGSYIDAAMIDGCYSMLAMHVPAWGTPTMPGRGTGLVNGGAPYYRCYRCSDGGYMSVAALERPFFERLWKTLGLRDTPTQYDRGLWPAMTETLAACFLAHSRDHWTQCFAGVDACVYPVLDPVEASKNAHLVARFGSVLPAAPVIPRFADGNRDPPVLDLTDRTHEVLAALDLPHDIAVGGKNDAANQVDPAFTWPPRFTG